MYVFKGSLTAEPYGFFSHDTADLHIYIIKIPLRLFLNQEGLNSDAKTLKIQTHVKRLSIRMRLEQILRRLIYSSHG